jgi:2-C-methyl-D-erythritol 4-phosphate cytidylyltransferase
VTTQETLGTVVAVVVAAGRGTRFGSPKHAVPIDGVPMWELSVRVFDSLGIPVVVVGDVPGGVPGGPRRRDSVAAGLAAVGDAEFVLVHDAARPMLDPSLVTTLVDVLRHSGADGVVPALPVTDTVKRVAGDVVVGTVDRTELVAVQTPQGFRSDVLRAAHAIDPDEDVTDDAGLVERLGGTIRWVPGDPANIKITYRDDLVRVRDAALRVGPHE